MKCLMPIFLLLTATAYSTDVYMKTDGNDSNAGDSWANAVATLAGACAKITANGTHNIYIKQGTYNNSPAATLSYYSTTIQGGYEGSGTPGAFTLAATNTILDAGNNNRILTVTYGGSGRDLTIKGLTFRNGKVTATAAGGGAAIYQSNTNTIAWTIDNCNFENNSFETNTGAASGGAIYIQQALGTDSLISNCRFTSNSLNNTGTASGADGFGGALRVNAGNWARALTVRDCVFSGNSVTLAGSRTAQGGAICFISSGQLTVERCSFTDNSLTGLSGSTANWQGGAIYRQVAYNTNGSQNWTARNCYFYNNTIGASTGGTRTGAAVTHVATGTPNTYTTSCSLIHCTFDANDDDVNCVFLGNPVDNGTQAHAVTNCIFSNNQYGVSAPAGVRVNIDYPLWHNNSAGNTGGLGTFTITPASPATGNPQYVVSGGYAIGITSPAIDAGTATGAAADDIQGGIRPFDEATVANTGDGGTSFYDIGCDEYGVVPAQVSSFSVE